MATTSTTGLYEFDPYGNSPDNLIVDEGHALQVPGRDDYYFIIPKAAPFFATTLEVKSSTGLVYREGVDYLIGHTFVEATSRTGKVIAGSIRFLRRDITGVVYVRYQTLGGEWGFDDNAILQELSNKLVNPLIRSWAEIDTLPNSFPPVPHDQSVDEIIGFEEVTSGLEDIRREIEAASAGATQAHTMDRENPHQVTKHQVGLGFVENYPIASVLESTEAARNDRYMTPARTRVLVSELANKPINSHLLDVDNPHQVTKTQVGLGRVENYATADTLTTVLGNATNLYTTPRGVREAISHAIDGPVTDHFTDYNNPHQVTKTQVGLSDVENYGVAGTTESEDGTRSDLYMTARGTRSAILKQVMVPLNAFMARTDNPHAVNKAQVGLSNVANYPVATYAEATGMSLNNRYLTPFNVKGAIERYFQENMGGLVTGDPDSPIQINKETIGLGFVENYKIATIPEMKSGELNSRYATPLGVKEAIDHQVGLRVTSHIDDMDNPHQVTASQVGAYNKQEIGDFLLEKLDADAAAVDALKVYGYTKDELLTELASGSTAGDSAQLEGLDLDRVLERATNQLLTIEYMSQQTAGTYVKLFVRDYSSEVSNNPMPLLCTYVSDTEMPTSAMLTLPAGATGTPLFVSMDHQDYPLEIYTVITPEDTMEIWYKATAKSQVLAVHRMVLDKDNNIVLATGEPADLVSQTQPAGSVLVEITDPLTQALIDAFDAATAELA